MQAWLDVMRQQIDLAGVILLALLGLMIAFLVRAQQDPNFDWKEALCDDAGKVSFLRVAGLGCFAFHSWALMKSTLQPSGPDIWVFSVYGAIWSGAPVAGKLIEALQAKWSK